MTGKNWKIKLTVEDINIAIRQYYSYIFEQIDRRFANIDNKQLQIRIRFSDILILESNTSPPWTQGDPETEVVEARELLSKFQDWVIAKSFLGNYDHVMLFTRYDLKGGGMDSVAGLAYIGGICTRSSVSVVEDRHSNQLVTIATHELGHSLGCLHDGDKDTCSSENNNIMSEVSEISRDLSKNRNSWIFSDCSVQQFQSNLLNKYHDGYGEICALMFCWVSRDSCSFHVALDGTFCGTNKVCSNGFCIGNSDSSKTSAMSAPAEFCPFGDQLPPLEPEGAVCSQVVRDEPYKCYERELYASCCASCNAIHTILPGCEYGDKKSSCASVGRFECLIDSSTCCATCAVYAADLKDWKFPVVVGVVVIGTCLIGIMIYYMVRRLLHKKSRTSGCMVSYTNELPEHQRTQVFAV
ncbi:MIG17-like protein [Mya arenaria]|uniref:MIG17-like protein n=2 Tax=Mya arenaria TaxID=6604 RepID=A0ABY7FEY5_MYAAR|nr:MIG17-like protein [Mya arenaria]